MTHVFVLFPRIAWRWSITYLWKLQKQGKRNEKRLSLFLIYSENLYEFNVCWFFVVTFRYKWKKFPESLFLSKNKKNLLLIYTAHVCQSIMLSAQTGKTLCRKLETNIPRNEIARPRSQFLDSWICERFIYSHDRSPIWLQQIMWPNCGDIKIGNSQTPSDASR